MAPMDIKRALGAALAFHSCDAVLVKNDAKKAVAAHRSVEGPAKVLATKKSESATKKASVAKKAPSEVAHSEVSSAEISEVSEVSPAEVSEDVPAVSVVLDMKDMDPKDMAELAEVAGEAEEMLEEIIENPEAMENLVGEVMSFFNNLSEEDVKELTSVLESVNGQLLETIRDTITNMTPQEQEEMIASVESLISSKGFQQTMQELLEEGEEFFGKENMEGALKLVEEQVAPVMAEIAPAVSRAAIKA